MVTGRDFGTGDNMRYAASRRHAGELSQSLRDRRWNRRHTVFALLFVFALIGWSYILFVSDALTVQEVEAPGLKILDAQELEREVYGILDGREGWRPWSPRHIWFIDGQKLQEKIKDHLFVLSVDVDKVGFNVLRLKIEERSKRFVFYSHRQYFWADMQGVLGEELSLEERRDVQARILGQRPARIDEPPLIHVDLDEDVTSGYVIGRMDEVRSWIQTSEELLKAGIAYREYSPPTSSSTVGLLRSQEGYPVVMDTSQSLSGQIKTFLAFVQSKPKDLKVEEYVDVRIPGRIYVK